ncbi:MAG TPA: hypothetical protein VK498_06435 [Ferruginibacter sp.]|nr:hypothetical protein [Ferruginibacter sp.]
MKKLISYSLLFFSAIQLSAQGRRQFPNIDSARVIVVTAKNAAEKFFALRVLDRYYYTTGLYDSSASAQTEMYMIAKDLKIDSLMSLVYRAIGNRYVTKSDYNFSLASYHKALDYSDTELRTTGLYGNIAYVYAMTGNNKVALDYINKMAAYGQTGIGLFFKNLLYGLVYNNMNKPDSSLFYIRAAENIPGANPDPLLYAALLFHIGKANELNNENDIAEAYYKKTMVFCREKNIASSLIRYGNGYCDFLLKSNRYEEAKQIAKTNLLVAQKTNINEGISTVAEVLRKIYTHSAEKDSIIFYAQMQIDYKDSVNNQQKIAEFQNLTFSQQLREIDEQKRVSDIKLQRDQNIQYALIALGIVIFIIFYLLLSRSFITNKKMIEFLGVIALLIVFEFLNLLLHPFLEKITNHSTVLMLLALVCIAAMLVPLHHKVEKWATAKLVEKNKRIRLAAAKRTIEELEGR